MEGIVAMNKKHRQIYQLATAAIRQKLTVKEFSLLIERSYRQARRIVMQVREKDALALRLDLRWLHPHISSESSKTGTDHG